MANRLAGLQLRRDGELLFELLLVVQPGVVAAACEQLFMAAELRNPSFDEHGDLVCVARGGDAVRDQDRREVGVLVFRVIRCIEGWSSAAQTEGSVARRPGGGDGQLVGEQTARKR